MGIQHGENWALDRNQPRLSFTTEQPSSLAGAGCLAAPLHELPPQLSEPGSPLSGDLASSELKSGYMDVGKAHVAWQRWGKEIGCL